MQNIDAVGGTKNCPMLMNVYEFRYTNTCICVQVFFTSTISKNQLLPCNRITADAFVHAEVFALSHELATINFT